MSNPKNVVVKKWLLEVWEFGKVSSWKAYLHEPTFEEISKLTLDGGIRGMYSTVTIRYEIVHKEDYEQFYLPQIQKDMSKTEVTYEGVVIGHTYDGMKIDFLDNEKSKEFQKCLKEGRSVGISSRRTGDVDENFRVTYKDVTEYAAFKLKENE